LEYETYFDAKTDGTTYRFMKDALPEYIRNLKTRISSSGKLDAEHQHIYLYCSCDNTNATVLPINDNTWNLTFNDYGSYDINAIKRDRNGRTISKHNFNYTRSYKPQYDISANPVRDPVTDSIIGIDIIYTFEQAPNKRITPIPPKQPLMHRLFCDANYELPKHGLFLSDDAWEFKKSIVINKGESPCVVIKKATDNKHLKFVGFTFAEDGMTILDK